MVRESALARRKTLLPTYGSENVYRCKRKTMPFRCRDCKKYFSVKTGTAMESSNLPLRKWVWVIYLEITNLKGGSSEYRGFSDLRESLEGASLLISVFNVGRK